MDLAEATYTIGEIQDKIKHTPPIIKEWIIEYLSYYALSLAQSALKIKDVEWIRFREWWFTVLSTLIKVFKWQKIASNQWEQIKKSDIPDNEVVKVEVK